MKNTTAKSEYTLQEQYINKIAHYYNSLGMTPLACVVTFGCQQNTSDSEKIMGILSQMGFSFCKDTADADFILFNTCAVREHAQLKVYGNIGALKSLKAAKPHLIIAMCGCMMQQQEVQAEIKKSYRHVDMVFGPSLFYRLPEMLCEVLFDNQRIFDMSEHPEIIENIPVMRQNNSKAWVTIMYGCDNFCSYCIVPYVRNRQRSRRSADIIDEVRELISQGYKDITLLGQNVNSYGLDLEGEMDFADLLIALNSLEGDFWLRFVTSHPKDCTHKLLKCMARGEKICKQLQLPFQAGNNRILSAMNRGYSAEQYIDLVEYAKKIMPSLTLTSDVIVGFPGESDNEFLDTIKLVERVRFDNLYTFIYSKRTGTPACEMEDLTSPNEKMQRFNKLLKTQHTISKQINDQLMGKTLRVFVEGVSKSNEMTLTGKTEGGKTVDFYGEKAIIGSFCMIKITQVKTWSLFGEIIN